MILNCKLLSGKMIWLILRLALPSHIIVLEKEVRAEGLTLER